MHSVKPKWALSKERERGGGKARALCFSSATLRVYWKIGGWWFVAARFNVCLIAWFLFPLYKYKTRATSLGPKSNVDISVNIRPVYK